MTSIYERLYKTYTYILGKLTYISIDSSISASFPGFKTEKAVTIFHVSWTLFSATTQAK